MIIGQELVDSVISITGIPVLTNTSLVVMAPRRSRKVQGQGLQVANNPAGAQADGGHHHLNYKTQSIRVAARCYSGPQMVNGGTNFNV